MVLRSGKYKGKTLEWVEEFDSNYLDWIKENRPEMLKEKPKPKIVKEDELPDSPISALKPNLNFDNEKQIRNNGKI